MKDLLYTTHFSTSFSVEKSDFIKYIYDNKLLNKELMYGQNGSTFSITEENIKAIHSLLWSSKYYTDSCYIENSYLSKFPFIPDTVEEVEVKEESKTPLIDLAQEILTNDDEHRKYGDMIESTKRTADVASVLFGKYIPTELVTIIYIAGKLCREGYSHKEDNLVDAIAYLEILNKIKKAKK